MTGINLIYFIYVAGNKEQGGCLVETPSPGVYPILNKYKNMKLRFLGGFTCSLFMSMVAFSLTSWSGEAMCQTKTLLSLEQVAKWSPECENATCNTCVIRKCGWYILCLVYPTSSVWPWRTEARTVGVSSTSLLYSSSPLKAPSLSLWKLLNKKCLSKDMRSNLVDENLREKSLQKRRFQRGPSRDAANHCEQTRPQAKACRIW